MKKTINVVNKLCLNTLIDDMKNKFDAKEKLEIIEKLNKTYTYAQISAMTGIPKSTISTWVMRGGEDNKSPKRKNLISLIEYFESYNPDIDEWGSLEKLRDTLNDILEKK